MEHVSHFNPAGLASQSREAVRDTLFPARILRHDRSSEHQVRVRNLSAGGMMAECDAAFATGDIVSVVLPAGGTVTGKIAWQRGERVGIAFDQEIDPVEARKTIGEAATPPYPEPLAPERLRTG